MLKDSQVYRGYHNRRDELKDTTIIKECGEWLLMFNNSSKYYIFFTNRSIYNYLLFGK